MPARVEYSFTFSNADPDQRVSFDTDSAVYASETGSVRQEFFELDADSTVTVWSDAATLTAVTTDGLGAVLRATATHASPSVTSDDGTAPANPAHGAATSAAPYSAADITQAPYNAKNDGVIAQDAAMTSGSNVLTCATTHPFTSTSVDGGKPIIVNGAGAAGIDLVTTITSVTDSGHAVLAANAATTVASATVHFGSNNYVAMQAVLDAMAADKRLFAPAGVYMIDGALKHAATVGAGLNKKVNAQLVFPSIDNLTADKPVGELWGASPQHHIPGDAGIRKGGTIFVSCLTGASYDATYGWPSVFGGPDPVNFAGGGTFTGYSNLMFVGRNFRVRQVRNPSAVSLNLFGLESADLDGIACDTTEGDYLSASMAAPTHPTGGGVAMPAPVGSNTPSWGGKITCYGYYWGFADADHTVVDYLVSIYNKVALFKQPNNYHTSKFTYLCGERCAYLIANVDPTSGVIDFPAAADGQRTYALDALLDTEQQAGNPTWQQTVTDVKDANSVLQGKVRVTGQNASARLTPDNRLVVTGALNLDIEYQIDGPWHAATLQNSWVALDAATYDVPGYRRTRNGDIELRGVAKSGSTTPGDALFTLPAAYRPLKQKMYVTSSAGTGLSSIEINNVTGDVFIDAATTNSYLTLDGIRFKAAIQ